MGEVGFDSVCEYEEDAEREGGDLVFKLGFHGGLLPHRCRIGEVSRRADVVFE